MFRSAKRDLGGGCEGYIPVDWVTLQQQRIVARSRLFRAHDQRVARKKVRSKSARGEEASIRFDKSSIRRLKYKKSKIRRRANSS